MTDSSALVIEAALNGATGKAANPNVPRSPAEVAADALAVLDAGAGIVHTHADATLLEGRHPAAPYTAAYREIRSARPEAVLYPTMGGGGPHTTAVERYAHVEELAGEGLIAMAPVDPGSVAFGIVGRGGPLPTEIVYQNTPADAHHMFGACTRLGLGASISIFEPGFLRVALAFQDAGLLPPGSKVQLYFGGPRLLFGLPPTRASLDAYTALLDGRGLPWFAGVIGGVLPPEVRDAVLERGGHLRVGLEDHGGDDQPTNVALVDDAVAAAGRAGRSVATPEEAAAILGLPAGRAAPSS